MNKKTINKRTIIADFLLLAIILNLIYMFGSDILLSYNQKMDLYQSTQTTKKQSHSKDEKNFEIKKDDSTITSADINLNTIGVMWVPSIKLKIPIYEDKKDYMQGPSELALSSGAARIKALNDFPDVDRGLSKSSRVILTAHTGLSIGALFNDLPKIKTGDMVYVKDLRNKHKYAYKITKTEIVEPTEVKKMLPEAGHELLTLLSCYPIFINNKRILVTGERYKGQISNNILEELNIEKPTIQGTIIENKIVMVILAALFFVIVKIIFDIYFLQKNKKKNTQKQNMPEKL